MKFLSYRHNKADIPALLDCGQDVCATPLLEDEPLMYTVPDTAIHINKRPFFIPDYAQPCLMQLRWAVRISRLGRCISPRFASRYYDAITVCAHCATPALPAAQGLCFDDCITIGEWLPVAATDIADAANGMAGAATDIADAAIEAIAEVSRYYTLRQGDILLLDGIAAPTEVHIDQHIEHTLNATTTLLSFNIK